MIEDPTVVFTATQRGWALRLRGHAADHGGLLVRATVLTEEDAESEHCDVLIVDDITSFLTHAFVERIHARGRSVLGVYDPADAYGKGHLIDVGVDAVIESDADTMTFVAQLSRLAAVHPDDRPPRPAPDLREVAHGPVVGVTGPSGGVGVTEIAIELSATLASARQRTVLVDADESAPCLAQRLGLALHPNLHTAGILTERAEALAPCLQPLATSRPLAVLTGMATGEDWETLRPGTAGGVTGRLSREHDTVVVDLGHVAASTEGATGLRFGHARMLAHDCDALVVVATPTPVAIARTIELIADLSMARAQIHLVLNRIGRDRYVRDEAVSELRQATGAQIVHAVAEDESVGRAAWQGGRVARGAFRRQVGQVAVGLGVPG